ncbi:MAG: 23S rRNA (guanosine(2251)-2'-O)-methyltransferase RlmB [Pseudomonadota bacterium]
MAQKKPAKAKKKQGGRKGQGTGTQDDHRVLLYGAHAVRAALSNDARRFHRIVATQNAASRFQELAESRGLAIEVVNPQDISNLTGQDAVHQGIAALADPLDGGDIQDLSDASLVVVLDQVTDPHNVGAIIRSAVALDADAIVTTRRNTARETGLLAKTASGGLDHLTVVTVGNLAQALTQLTDSGFQVIGLDSEGEADLSRSFAYDKIALVFGAEGAGLRRLTRERCERLARLDMPGPIKSLNVSNAATLALYMAKAHLDRPK